jgi:5S rRNA maturation endonuclease (ribonuclease M5)
LSTHIKDKIEKIQQTIKKLKETSTSTTAIIVEGKKDEQALREIGITATILTIKTGGKNFPLAITEIQKLNPQETILLLDFDRRGKEATKRLQKELEHLKIKTNLQFWRELKALLGHEMQCIESLPKYLLTLSSKTTNKQKPQTTA